MGGVILFEKLGLLKSICGGSSKIWAGLYNGTATELALKTDTDNAKATLANAIVSKGGTATSSMTFAQLASAIGNLSTLSIIQLSDLFKPFTYNSHLYCYNYNYIYNETYEIMIDIKANKLYVSYNYLSHSSDYPILHYNYGSTYKSIGQDNIASYLNGKYTIENVGLYNNMYAINYSHMKSNTSAYFRLLPGNGAYGLSFYPSNGTLRWERQGYTLYAIAI